MYFFDYKEEHQGKLTKVGYKSTMFGQLYRLIVKFDDGYNSGPQFPDELVIQSERPLGRRLSLMHLEDYINETLRIKREGNLFWFYDANDKCIGLVGLTEEWTKTEDEEWFDNLKYKYNYEDQARFFGRTIDEVKIRDGEIFYTEGLKRSLTATTKGTLNEIKGVPESILTFGVSIKPGIKDSDGTYYGESFKIDEKSKINVSKIVSKKSTLFELSKEEGLHLTTLMQTGNIITIQSTSNEELLEYEFFQECSHDSDFYVWLKLEDFNEGTFSSYSYAFGRDLEELKGFAETREADFLRHIMYLRSEQTKRLNAINEEEKENTRFQAIRSAIAVIMSRNMSHNLGSHVLYYTQRDLLEAANQLRLDVLELVHQKDNAKKLISTIIDNKYDKYLRGGAHLVAFLKNRMNFIAAVCEDKPFPNLPVSFTNEIFQYLDIDKCSPEDKPIINFYLKNIIRSEGYSREERKKVPVLPSTRGELNLKLKEKIGKEQIPLKYLNISLPGGVLSIQAFCNIIENFIRNSAKYWSRASDKIDNLEITIRTIIVEDELCVVIHDNKKDAKQTVNLLNDKLFDLSILNSDNSINKENKGLKEMLLSYLWLISNTLDESVSSYVLRTEKIGDSLRRKFRFVAVDENEAVVSVECVERDINLGLMFYLPIHHNHIEIETKNIKNLRGLFADVYSAESKLISKYNLEKYFPRIVNKSDCSYQISSSTVQEEPLGKNYSDTSMLYQSMCKRFGFDVDSLKISMGGLEESLDCPEDMCICFNTHFSDKTEKCEKLKLINDKYFYYDSISGANYTTTLHQLWSEMLLDNDNNGNASVKTWRDKALALKIKESALTRITIIDERLLAWIKKWIDLDSSSDDCIRNSQVELTLKNIRVLNWSDDESVKNSPLKDKYHKIEGFPICGNEFRDKNNKTTFLSIHLGLIEKMLNGTNAELIKICGEKGDNALSKERISLLMESIKRVFAPNFICIHSGRGGLSKELEDTILSEYPFVPFATLESLFNDSKFLLSQMFYSLNYNPQNLK